MWQWKTTRQYWGSLGGLKRTLNAENFKRTVWALSWGSEKLSCIPSLPFPCYVTLSNSLLFQVSAFTPLIPFLHKRRKGRERKKEKLILEDFQNVRILECLLMSSVVLPDWSLHLFVAPWAALHFRRRRNRSTNFPQFSSKSGLRTKSSYSDAV